MVLIGVVVGALGGAALTLIGDDRYQAEALLVVVPSDPRGDVEDEYGIITAKLATRPNVVGGALSEAGFEEIAEEPDRAITSRASVESPSFSVTATAGSASEAAVIANAVAVAVEDFTRKRQERTGFRAAVLGPGGEPTEQAGLGLGVAVLAGAALGLSLAAIAVLSRPPG